jgi:hypothetical protein
MLTSLERAYCRLMSAGDSRAACDAFDDQVTSAVRLQRASSRWRRQMLSGWPRARPSKTARRSRILFQHTCSMCFASIML